MHRRIVPFLLLLIIVGCATKKPDKKAILRERLQRTNDTFRVFNFDRQTPAIEVDLPLGYEMNRTRGVDFDVYYFQNPNAEAAMGIYVGLAPNYHPTGHIVEGTAAGQPVKWVQRQDKDGFHADALVQNLFGKSHPNHVLHIFINGSTIDAVEQMKQAAETIRLAQKAK